jgi:hypothetical protein
MRGFVERVSRGGIVFSERRSRSTYRFRNTKRLEFMFGALLSEDSTKLLEPARAYSRLR